MFRRTFLAVLAVVGLGGVAHAAVVAPSIVDPAATVFYDPSTPSFFVTASNPVATPTIDPAPDFALFIDTLGSTVTLTVEDVSFNTILEATGTGFSTGPDGIAALLQTVTDTTGLFGSRLLVSMNIANFDPSQAYGGVLGELVIENAPAPIPLPAGAPLLAGGFALLWSVRRRPAAA